MSRRQILVIVESPSKCKKIEEFLGPMYKVVACNGQVRTIAHLNDVNLETWEPKYTLVSEHRAAIQRIISAAKQAEEVIIGTDADSMGENIGWHCCVVLGLNPTQIKRIKFSEISRGAIAAAIAVPTTLDMRVVMAQQARQIIDIVIGYTISPLLWARFPHEREGLSAGRCQTPALRIVNDNQRLFALPAQGSTAEMHYVVSGSFAFPHTEYPEKGLPLSFELDGDIADLDDTQQFLCASKSFCHQFSRNEPSAATVAPPLPLTTSTLLQLASTELQSSPKETMKSAQMLYEGGYITYMRTEGTTYSAEFCAAHGKAPTVEASGEAHEAIRPTDLSIKEAGATTKDKRIYALIRQRCIESLGDPAQVTNMTVYLSAPQGRRYRATKQRVDVAGWMGTSSSCDAGFVSNTRIFNFLEALKDPVVPYVRIMARQTPVHRPLHLTEAGLVEQLEKRGIGRPSTFASLTNKIVERNYVVRQDTIQGQEVECTDLSLENDIVTQLTHQRVMGSERRKLVITPLGANVATFLEQRFAALFDYEYTKHMEKELDRIEGGLVEWSAVCSAFYFGLQQSINSVVEDTDVVPIVLETKTAVAPRGRLLGRWSDQDLYLCRGKYGLMAAWGDQTASLKCFGNRPVENISYEDVVDVLNTETTVRDLSPNLSIRQGKYGPYIYFKTPKMRKPQFYQLKEYKETYMTCDAVDLSRWILETYGVH